MLNINNDDSTSSEDEISKNALQEATDHHFLKDSYFSSTKSENSDISERVGKHNRSIGVENLTNVKSLRTSLQQQDKFENFGASPSYQNYVARKLDEIIEKSIKVKRKSKNEVVMTCENASNNSGIKLLNSSIEFLTTEEEDTKLQKPLKRRKIKATVDDKLNILKCKEVAVDPEWILSKAETKAWTSKRKEPEFKYKRLKNGTLSEET